MSSDPQALVDEYQLWAERLQQRERLDGHVGLDTAHEAVALLERMAERWLPLQMKLANAAERLGQPDMDSTWSSMSCSEVESLRELFEDDHLETAYWIIAQHQASSSEEPGDLHYLRVGDRVTDWRDGRQATVTHLNDNHSPQIQIVVAYDDDQTAENLAHLSDPPFTTSTLAAWFHSNEED